MKSPQLPWEKMPAVRGGGKGHFWWVKTPQGAFNVVWDRLREKWVAHTGPYHADQELAEFNSDVAGKKYVEDLVNT